MIDWTRFGPLLAVTLAGAAVAGAILLITLDFASAEDAGGPLADRLKDVASISLFTEVAVPGTDLQVHTGTEYADAAALAAGRVDHRWCYLDRAKPATAFSPEIQLGHQVGNEPPVFVSAGVTAEEARTLGVPVDGLATVAHRDCRFGSGQPGGRP